MTGILSRSKLTFSILVEIWIEYELAALCTSKEHLWRFVRELGCTPKVELKKPVLIWRAFRACNQNSTRISNRLRRQQLTDPLTSSHQVGIWRA
jgi:hypothetical protein